MAKLKAVAQLANVSIATVSRILNNDETLSVTEDKKNKSFYELKYESNLQSSSLHHQNIKQYLHQ